MQKRIWFLVLTLTLLQLSRLFGLWLTAYMSGLGGVVDTLFQTAWMGLLTVLLLAAGGQEGRVPLLPRPFGKGDVALSAAVAAFFLLTALIRLPEGTPGLLFLIYGALITPIFEEMLFRGRVWGALEGYGERRAWLGSALLFGLWHLGYVPSILWRTALLGHPVPPLEAAAWKLLTGGAFGLLFGAARYRQGSIWRALLLHVAVNSLGS